MKLAKNVEARGSNGLTVPTVYAIDFSKDVFNAKCV